jgi:hypothetical protein
MKARLKLWLRRWALRQLRYLVDVADDRLHSAEVNLREELAARTSLPVRPAAVREGTLVATPKCARGPSQPEKFLQWEARKSGVAVISKKEARRRRGISAAEFDLQFAKGV